MNSPATILTPMNNLATQLQQIGLRALPPSLDDFIARATKGGWSPHMLLQQLAQAEAEARSRRSLERALAGLWHQELQAHGGLRMDLAEQGRTRGH
jgi:hypothetical protein